MAAGKEVAGAHQPSCGEQIVLLTALIVPQVTGFQRAPVQIKEVKEAI